LDARLSQKAKVAKRYGPNKLLIIWIKLYNIVYIL